MLGVDRSVLQELIYKGELKTFEGMLDMEAVRHHFPMIALTEEGEYERTRLIRASAFARRVASTVAPDTDTLENRLRKADSDRSLWRARAQRYNKILLELGQQLTEWQGQASDEQKVLLRELNSWLKQRIER